MNGNEVMTFEDIANNSCSDTQTGLPKLLEY